MSEDTLTIGSHTFNSRLFTGTGKYPNVDIAEAALKASECDVVTVAVRRVDLSQTGRSIATVLKEGKYTILPNTAGCYTVKDAVRTARLAREMLDTKIVKLEVIGDEETLFPDVPGTLEAAKALIDEGFEVLPYITDDPISCKKLEDMGCVAVMPLASPIGSGLGICNPRNIEIIVKRAGVPVVIDAGVGTASDAAFAMELGASAVLMNTAIAGTKDPVGMAHAMKHGVMAGRAAFLSGRIAKKLYATASSPLQGVIGSSH